MGNSYDCPMMRAVEEDGEMLVNEELNPHELNICIEVGPKRRAISARSLS